MKQRIQISQVNDIRELIENLDDDNFAHCSTKLDNKLYGHLIDVLHHNLKFLLKMTLKDANL